jgi:hypothetical protein
MSQNPQCRGSEGAMIKLKEKWPDYYKREVKLTLCGERGLALACM